MCLFQATSHICLLTSGRWKFPLFNKTLKSSKWPKCGSRQISQLTELEHSFSSVQLSRSVVSDSLQPHESQHARPPCPSPTPRVCPNSCPSSQWCHPAISSCHSLLLLPSIFASIRVFSNESALYIRCQSIGVSASTSVLPMNTQNWSPLGWTSWISLQSKGLSKPSPALQLKSINSSALTFLTGCETRAGRGNILEC